MKKIIQISSMLLVVMLLFSWQPVAAQTCTNLTTNAGITPELLKGNPVLCSGGVRIENPTSQTYVLDMYGNSVTIVVTNTDCGQVFKWTASPGIAFDYIVVKGGPNANGYDYSGLSPLPTEDYFLHSPVQSGKYAGLSHIDFCIKYTLGIEKTAVPAFTREYTWEIEKTPDKTINLFTGDTYTHRYTIDLDRTETDKEWAVSGAITITNPAPFAASITDVSDVISGSIAVSVDCGVSFPYDLAAGGTLVCTYQSALPDATSRVNTATVTTSGKVAGNSATANIIFGDPTSIVGFPTVNVTDSYEGALGSFSDDGSTSYTREFYCGLAGGNTVGNSTTYVNTATIVETGQSDNATVTINCFDLTVNKNAVPSFDRKYIWDIQKTEDQVDCVELEFGQLATINYEVSVWMDYYIDSNWAVEGQITISNPAPMDAPLTEVTDMISPDIPANVSCPALIVPAKGSMVCTYSANLPDEATRTNTATAVLQNYDYAWNNLDGVASASTQPYSGTAAINFAGVIPNPIDECVDVSDTYAGYLGEVCVEDSPKTFTYTRDIGIFEGEYECDFYYYVDNTASFITNDTETTDSDDAQVCFYIPCTPPGCETAYAMGDDAICFIPDYASNWGWTNPIIVGEGPYVWDLWAAAGQCDTDKGTLVGTVTVTFNPAGSSGKYNVIVDFDVDSPFMIEETHVHVGAMAYPGPDIGNWENVGTYLPGTTVYVIAHAVVCGQFTNGAVETYNNSAGNLPEEAGFTEIESFDTFQVRSYPNPFSSAVTFNFTLPEESQVELVIYNLSGQVVARVAEGLYNAGNHNVTWTAPANLLNGLYIYRLQTPEHISIQKMLFAR